MDDQFTQIITQWEPWVKQIVDMRNAVDHPAQKPGGKLVTHNFRMEKGLILAWFFSQKLTL
jgi:hypothetical protein